VTRKVFVTRRVFNEAISRLEEHVQTEMNPVDDVLSSEELAERIQGVDGVLSMVTARMDRALMEGTPDSKSSPTLRSATTTSRCRLQPSRASWSRTHRES